MAMSAPAPTQEMAEWVEYMTADNNSTLAQLRRANGRDKPWRLHYFAVGNETWGCGGNMRPEFYADLYRQYATFIKTPRDNKPQRIASGANGSNTEWTEVLMREAGKHMDAISVHYYTLPRGAWKDKGAATGFPESEWMSTFKRTLRMDGILTNHSKIMDRLRSGAARLAIGRRMGHLVRRGAGHQRGLSVSAEQPARCAGGERSTSTSSIAHARSGAHDEHRADGERAAGHDPDRWTEDGEDADVPCIRACTSRFEVPLMFRWKFRRQSTSLTLKAFRPCMPQPREIKPVPCISRSRIWILIRPPRSSCACRAGRSRRYKGRS